MSPGVAPAVTAVALIAFAVALSWRIYQLQRAPRQLPMWAVTVTIACTAAAFVVQQPPVAHLVDEAGVGAARLLNNVLLCLALYSLLLFLLVAPFGPRRYRRALLELVPLVLTVGLMVLTLARTPILSRGAALSADTVHIPGVAWFYLIVGVYLIYLLLSCLWWIGRHQRHADRHLRTGLRLGGFGIACMAAGSILRAVYVAVAAPGGPRLGALLSVGALLVIVGSAGFLVGICYPGFRARTAALGRRRRHRRYYRDLSPLWTTLVRAYPDIVLRSAPRRPLDVLRPRTLDRRYYRRVIEIRDGLVQLSPYLPDDLATLAETDPADAARRVAAALRRRDADEPVGHEARLVLPAAGGDLESDVRPLLALSRAMPTPAAAAPAG